MCADEKEFAQTETSSLPFSLVTSLKVSYPSCSYKFVTFHIYTCKEINERLLCHRIIMSKEKIMVVTYDMTLLSP